MRSPFSFQLSRLKTRLTWPGVVLMLLLQRAPLPRVISELQFSIGPRLVHLLKWVVGAGITTGAYNAVTAATGDLSTFGNTTVEIGENMQVSIVAEKAVPLTVSLTHPTDADVTNPLPPGLITNIGEGGQLTPIGVVAFSGIPTVAGEYPARVTILTWEGKNGIYDGPPVFIDFVLNVTLSTPGIVQAPVSQQPFLGATLTLEVEVEDEAGVTYQWQKNVGSNPNLFGNIEGAVSRIYSVAKVTSGAQGVYRVIVTKNGLDIIAPGPSDPPAFVTVQGGTAFLAWKEKQFDDPDSEDAGDEGNPDRDGFPNLFEFVFGLDPNAPDSLQVPRISSEDIQGAPYRVLSFPPLVESTDLEVVVEVSDDLDAPQWTPLINGVDGVVIEDTNAFFAVKLPVSSRIFCRLRVRVIGGE